MMGQEGTTKERKHLFSCFFGLSERELSTVSREKGEGGSLFFLLSLVLSFPSMSWAPPFPSLPFCPLHLNFPASLAILFLILCVCFPFDQSVSKGRTHWLLPPCLPTELCTQKLSNPDVDRLISACSGLVIFQRRPIYCPGTQN